MRVHSIRRLSIQRKVVIGAGLLLLAGAAAAMEALSGDSEADASATTSTSVTTVSDSAAARVPEQPPIDLDPWQVTPANAPAPPLGQVPAWVLNAQPPEELAVPEDPPPPPRLPPEPHEAPWTQTQTPSVP